MTAFLRAPTALQPCGVCVACVGSGDPFLDAFLALPCGYVDPGPTEEPPGYREPAWGDEAEEAGQGPELRDESRAGGAS